MEVKVRRKENEDEVLLIIDKIPYAMMGSDEITRSIKDVVIRLDHGPAKIMAYQILDICKQLDYEKMRCDCGREKQCVCPICDLPGGPDD